RARIAHQGRRTRHGRRDHHRGLHCRGDRGPRLPMGNAAGLSGLWPHPGVRHPGLSTLLDLRGIRDHGCGARGPAVGPAGEAREVSQSRRIPWTLVLFLILLFVPVLGSRYYTFVATDIIIFAMFATSLNLLLGVTGLVPFGHAAYFGIGAYVCAIFMKDFGIPFLPAWLLGGFGGALFAAIFGFFCVRLTSVYFSMLTMAFAQIVWAICFKWNDVTGGEQGYPNVPMPSMAWLDWIPWVGDLKIDHKFFYLTLLLAALSIAAMRRIVHSPFGRMLTAIRDNTERTQFIGINVRLYQ